MSAWLAANRGDKQELCRELDSGADMEFRDPMGRTALMEAAKHGHVDCVHELLCRGADPTARSAVGWTASDFCGSHESQHGEINRLLGEAQMMWQQDRDKQHSQQILPHQDSNKENNDSQLQIELPDTGTLGAVYMEHTAGTSLLPTPLVVENARRALQCLALYFAQSGVCRFAHPAGPAPTPPPSVQPVCRYWRFGTCRYGSACRFRHPLHSEPVLKTMGVGVPHLSVYDSQLQQQRTRNLGLTDAEVLSLLSQGSHPLQDTSELLSTLQGFQRMQLNQR
ncbi:MAG: hypothetical protein FRX49_12805 [Trebouxia sp. A1-2]|nr:MAG: hypothetical protein FRX49_12805 [Trebouxia sp. A1-2]